MTWRTKKVQGAVLAAAALALAAPGAHALSAAIPAASDQTWDGHIGFDWAARAGRTHLVADALDGTTTLDLGEVGTPFVDIEVLHLEPGLALKVADTVSGATYRDGAYPNGRLVLWDVPALSGTITLTRARDGSPVTTIVLAQNSFPMSGSRGSIMYPTRPCAPCGENTPYRVSYDDGTAWVTLNGVISTTPEVTVSVTSSWEHTNTFHASADFGAAAASIGHSRSFSWTQEASTTLSSEGAGQVGLLLVYVRTEYWSDGSKSVYMTGPAWGAGSVGWGWQPPRCCNPFIIENAATNGAQEFSLREANSGAVTWTAAWNHNGLSGSAGTTSTWDNDATVTFSFHPTDDARHTYTWNVITGDRATTGMVGWVYKDT